MLSVLSSMHSRLQDTENETEGVTEEYPALNSKGDVTILKVVLHP